MCGRVNVSDLEGLDELMAAMAGQPTPVSDLGLNPRWNVAPTQALAVARVSDGGVCLQAMSWGLTASRAASNGTHSRPLFNARSETLFTKRSFRDHARQHRAIIPINGYYEWQRNGQRRQAWYLSPDSARGGLLAAVWNGDTTFPCCSIVTRAAPASLAHVHHRMPVVLAVGNAVAWLSDDTASRAVLADDTGGLAWSGLRVGDYVNATGNDGPECIEPDADGPDTQTSLW